MRLVLWIFVSLSLSPSLDAVLASIVAISDQSFAIFANHINWYMAKILINKERIPDAQLEIIANAVKKDTYEWKLITHCVHKENEIKYTSAVYGMHKLKWSKIRNIRYRMTGSVWAEVSERM